MLTQGCKGAKRTGDTVLIELHARPWPCSTSDFDRNTSCWSKDLNIQEILFEHYHPSVLEIQWCFVAGSGLVDLDGLRAAPGPAKLREGRGQKIEGSAVVN